MERSTSVIFFWSLLQLYTIIPCYGVLEDGENCPWLALGASSAVLRPAVSSFFSSVVAGVKLLHHY